MPLVPGGLQGRWMQRESPVIWVSADISKDQVSHKSQSFRNRDIDSFPPFLAAPPCLGALARSRGRQRERSGKRETGRRRDREKERERERERETGIGSKAKRVSEMHSSCCILSVHAPLDCYQAGVALRCSSCCRCV